MEHIFELISQIATTDDNGYGAWIEDTSIGIFADIDALHTFVNKLTDSGHYKHHQLVIRFIQLNNIDDYYKQLIGDDKTEN